MLTLSDVIQRPERRREELGGGKSYHPIAGLKYLRMVYRRNGECRKRTIDEPRGLQR